MKINIITSVSRPENLPFLKENIEKEIIPFFDVSWYCVYDIGKSNSIIDYNEAWIQSLKGGVANDCSGGSQRNEALNLIKDGWVYFLDDDNLFHQGYGEKMSNLINSNSSIKAFVVNQKHDIGDLLARPEKVRARNIDIAQVLINIDIIGNRRFFDNVYESDFFFIKKIFKNHKEKFKFIDEFICHYNFLRK